MRIQGPCHFSPKPFPPAMLGPGVKNHPASTRVQAARRHKLNPLSGLFLLLVFQQYVYTGISLLPTAPSQLFGHLEKLSDILGPSLRGICSWLQCRTFPQADLLMLELGWLPCLRAVLGFGILSFHIINPEPLLNFQLPSASRSLWI